MINPNAYYTVQGWMISELGLKGNALAVYAIIYGFSQDGVTEYAGSSKYLCEWLGCTKKTVLVTLAELVERGLLSKKEVVKDGVRLCNYVAKTPHWLRGGKEITQPEPQEQPTAPAEPGKRGRPKKDPNEPKPEKKVYGEFKHVKLTDEEHEKLAKKYGPEKAAAAIAFLDEYIEEKPGYKSQSHYLAIRRWVIDALNEKQRRSGQNQTQGRRPAGPIGPNGIVIDPTKNDLDGQF